MYGVCMDGMCRQAGEIDMVIVREDISSETVVDLAPSQYKKHLIRATNPNGLGICMLYGDERTAETAQD